MKEVKQDGAPLLFKVVLGSLLALLFIHTCSFASLGMQERLKGSTDYFCFLGACFRTATASNALDIVISEVDICFSKFQRPQCLRYKYWVCSGCYGSKEGLSLAFQMTVLTYLHMGL